MLGLESGLFADKIPQGKFGCHDLVVMSNTVTLGLPKKPTKLYFFSRVGWSVDREETTEQEMERGQALWFHADGRETDRHKFVAR